MDLHLNLEYLCRVCAANTKGKGNSVAECAYILKTPGLKDKLDKFLYLKIADNDTLPKVLCKSCFRQVEATASLSKIARHTQQVFRDFLLSNMPKTSSDPVHTSEVISSDFLGNKDSEKSKNERSLLATPANSRAQIPIAHSQPPQSTAPTLPPPPPTPAPPQAHFTPASSPRKDEVIVNVSVSDPLTRDNQLKMISNSQRRQSLLMEPRYTPTSIAQKVMSAPLAPPLPPPPPPQRPVVIKPVKVDALPSALTTNNQKTTTAPTQSLYQQHLLKQQQQQQQKQKQLQEEQKQQQLLQEQQQQKLQQLLQQEQQQQQLQKQLQQQLQEKQQQQQSSKLIPPSPAQVTTFSSGGYVIGNVDPIPSDKKTPKKSTLPLSPAADNVLQQKRKNLVKALNNIKANNSGQVSLLKSSQPKLTTQQKQAALLQQLTKTPLAEVVNQAAEDELPEQIIIAAPKNKSPEKSKKEPLNLSSKIITPKPAAENPTVTTTVITQEPAAPYNPPPAPKPTFPEDILLGRVIRDMDLLKLILKALQWPVDKQNIEAQLQRLKNSKFTDIMSDSNLLQDTDLTQLLGPYLAPVLLAAQALQQQQHQLLKNTTLNQNMSAAYITQKSPPTLDQQAEINKSMPYKLPPETSVQLVPATPEEQEQTSKSPPLATLATNSSSTTVKGNKRGRKKEPKPTPAPPKRQRRAAAQKARESIVILSDEDDDDEDDRPLKRLIAKQKTSKSSPAAATVPVPNIPIELNTNFLSQLGMLNGSGGEEANEALLALLNRQKAAMSKPQKNSRRRRNSISNMITLPASEFDSLIDLDDDIVLMEPVTTTSGQITSSDSLTSSSNAQQQQPQQQQQQLPQIDLNAFIMPQMPIITRPIIKRRKTVIQTSRPSFDINMDLLAKDSFLNNGQQSLQNSSNNGNVNLQQPSNNENQQNESAKSSSAGLIPNPPNSLLSHPTTASTSNTSTLSTASSSSQQKKLQNKSALGQQLLEAIGLQQIPTKYLSTPELATSSSLANHSTITASLPNTKKQSIKQIRFALKKSLKQAQEQQQQRKKELSSSNISTTTIIQDADSTTKSTMKEIVVVEGKGNKSDDCSSSLVDVEDQIDKVTLMVRGKNDKEKSRDTTTNTSAMSSAKEDTKEGKRLSLLKIPDRRRTVPASMTNRDPGFLLDTKVDRSSNAAEVVADTKIVDLDNDKSEKDDTESLNISSSSAITMPLSFADSMTSSTEMNQSKDEETAAAAPAPKKRGRKRLVDKLEEAKAAKSKEEEAETETEETTSNNKTEEQTTSNKKSAGRPTRQSKALSKYYKGPDRLTTSRRSLPSRSTRNSKYS